MLKTIQKVVAWILVTALLSLGIGCGKQASGKTAQLTLRFTRFDEEKNFTLSVARSDKNVTVNTGEYFEQFVYTVTVEKERGSEQPPITTQIFTVHSEIDDPSAIIELADIDHDDCPDLLVRTLQTVHSAAWYDAYRFLPEEERFEAEPFFTYLCSGLPKRIGGNQLMTLQATASETECALYQLGSDDRYHLLRSYFAEHYDGTRYTVTDSTSDKGETLYEQHFDGDLTMQDTLKINSLFFYGDTFSCRNELMTFAENYCFLRETGGDVFENARHMLRDNPSLAEQEQAYFATKNATAECRAAFATGMSETKDNTLRVYVTCFVQPTEAQGYQPKHLAVDLEYDSIYYDMSVCAVSDAPAPDDNRETLSMVEYEQDTDSFRFYWYDTAAALGNGKLPLSHIRYVDENVIEFRQGAETDVWYSQYLRTDTHEAGLCLPTAMYLGHGIALYPSRSNEFTLAHAFDEKAYRYSFSTGVFSANPADWFYRFSLVDSQHLKLSLDGEDSVDRIFTVPAIPGM